MFEGGLVRDTRTNFRQSASQPWQFGNYVDSSTFSNRRPQTTVDGLRCNTQYEFQVEYNWTVDGMTTAPSQPEPEPAKEG